MNTTMPKPNGFDSWNPALRWAYRKGYEAGISGASIASCPYQDKRKPSGGLSWSRSFISAWRDGWTAGSAGLDCVQIDNAQFTSQAQADK